MALKDWKKSKSNASIKSTYEGWFISWRKGRKEVEIIRFYDEDKHKWDGFEVWEQIRNASGDSWDGTHLATFKTEAEAVSYAKRYIIEVG